MGIGDILLGVTLRWTSIPSRGEYQYSQIASCYRNRDKLRPCGPPWLVCDFSYLPFHRFRFWFFGRAKIRASAKKKRKASFARALVFYAPKSEKCFKPAENPTETLATLAGTDTEN